MRSKPEGWYEKSPYIANLFHCVAEVETIVKNYRDQKVDGMLPLETFQDPLLSGQKGHRQP